MNLIPSDRNTIPTKPIVCWNLRGTNKIALLSKVNPEIADDDYVINVIGGMMVTMGPRPLHRAIRYLDAQSVDKRIVWDRYDFDTRQEFIAAMVIILMMSPKVN